MRIRRQKHGRLFARGWFYQVHERAGGMFITTVKHSTGSVLIPANLQDVLASDLVAAGVHRDAIDAVIANYIDKDGVDED